MTIIVPEVEPGPDDASVAFAAGVATAEASQAAEEAAEAVAVAEVAEAVAEAAVESAEAAHIAAANAAESAYDARAEIEAMRAEHAAGMQELRDMLADALVPAGPADEGMSPERIEREGGPAPDGGDGGGQEEEHDSEPARQGYGNQRWFGRR